VAVRCAEIAQVGTISTNGDVEIGCLARLVLIPEIEEAAHAVLSDWEAFVHLRSATIELAAFVRADGSSVPRDTAQHYALGMASDLI
jgi:hypothetical protein